MAIKVTCPRCNTALQVPPKLLGQYTQCPACQNRILIPINALVGAPAAAAEEPAAGNSSTVRFAAVTAGSATPPTRPPGPAAPSPVASSPAPTGESPASRSAASVPTASWTSHAPAEQPAPRKTARFITAETSAPTTVQLPPGGELPKLQLTESNLRKPGTKDSKLNPLVLVGAACLSFCLCVVLLLSDFEGPTVNSDEELKITQTLESYYKNQEGPLAPYQIELRDAQQARSRGDRAAEQRHYRKVLDLLHAERDPRDRFRGLTGTPQSDQNLERQLARLLTNQSGGGEEGE